MEPTKDWLDSLIRDQVEESTELEYKDGAALSRGTSEVMELTKDVSAFANANGGILIYGIGEDRARRHFPTGFAPVKRSMFSKEWVEQMCDRVQPRIAGLKIHPVHVGPDPDDWCYILEIPRGETAHQALTKTYPRRRNFKVDAMEDYEVREVMSRRKHPHVVISFRAVPRRSLSVQFRVENQSDVLARYYLVCLDCPTRIGGVLVECEDATFREIEGKSCWSWQHSNPLKSPLFPRSRIQFQKEFHPWRRAVQPKSEPIDRIYALVYADDMPPLTLEGVIPEDSDEWMPMVPFTGIQRHSSSEIS